MSRHRHDVPPVDHLAAAIRLEQSLQVMRDRPDDEPPTGLIDLAAIRAAIGLPALDVDPAAAAWLAGGPTTAAARALEQVDALGDDEPDSFEDWLRATDPSCCCATLRPGDACPAHPFDPTAYKPAPVEHPCLVLGNAYHSDAPCGPQHHPEPQARPAPPAQRAADVMLPAIFRDEHARFAPGADRGRPLTWASRHDERSRNYGVRRQLGAAVPITDRLWPVGPVGDQGTEGACVGWGVVDAVNARAAGDVDLTAPDALELYRRAQQLDTVPGENYTGTSVLAGMQAGVERGLFAGYSWCFGTRDIAQAVLQVGPVVIGVPWLSGMYDTGPGGLVELAGEDTGAGHCLAVVGILLRGPQGQLGPYFVWQNSWGPSYGDRGLGYIHHRDLASLLHGTGEAALLAVQQ